MENSELDALIGQINALARTLQAVVAVLEPLPAAEVSMDLAIECESLTATAATSRQDESTLALLTAFRDLAFQRSQSA
jgi:hypothetical protein